MQVQALVCSLLLAGGLVGPTAERPVEAAATRLSYAPAAGTVLEKRCVMSWDLQFDDRAMRDRGQQSKFGFVVPTRYQASLALSVTDACVAVDAAGPTRLERSFEELACRTALDYELFMVGLRSARMNRESDLSRRKVRFERAPQQADETKSFVDGKGPDPDLLAGLVHDMDATALLPRGEVRAGDTWEVEPAAWRSLLNPGGDLGLRSEDERGDAPSACIALLEYPPEQWFGELLGSGAATLRELSVQGGTRRATIDLELDLRSRRDIASLLRFEDFEVQPAELSLEWRGKGVLVWDLERSRLGSLSLDTRLAATIEASYVFAASFDRSQSLTRQVVCLSGPLRIDWTTRSP